MYHTNTCANCKWLDKTRTVYWTGRHDYFYICRYKELQEEAEKNLKRKVFVSFTASDMNARTKVCYPLPCFNMELPEWVKENLNCLDFGGGGFD